MKILLVKLSSLGDVIHALPVVQDIRAALPGAQIDWVVEKSFAPVLALCPGVQRVIPCEIRRWRRSPLSALTRQQWNAFKAELRQTPYDAVIDLQGLTKSALVARLARLAPGGQRYAIANQTDGSGYEAPTRWVADVAIRIEPRTAVVQRSRELAARALGYTFTARPDFGLKVPPVQAFATAPQGIHGQGPQQTQPVQATPDIPVAPAAQTVPAAPAATQAAEAAEAAREQALAQDALGQPTPHAAADNPAAPVVAFVHGTSRADKEWPLAHWIALGQRLKAAGYQVALPHGNAKELATSQTLADALNQGAPGSAQVWPLLPLDALTCRLARCAGVIGVDSGVSHIAVALDLPHVQIYNFDTAWRTGPGSTGRQVSVFAQPTPGVDAVWQAWLGCSSADDGAGAAAAGAADSFDAAGGAGAKDAAGSTGSTNGMGGTSGMGATNCSGATIEKGGAGARTAR